MIKHLQKKFILVSLVSVFLVILFMFALINILNFSSMNASLDDITDRLSENGGSFNNFIDDHGQLQKPGFNYINPETPFSTRYFTVFFDKNNQIVKTNTESIFSVDDALAEKYALDINLNKERGWYLNYRYKVFTTENGYAIVFVDGSTNRTANYQTMLISFIVLVTCGTVVLILIMILSTRVMKPVANAYEKQKQFITDANHELKTPLTLILANLDIAEAELGENEWLQDIRFEGQRMTELVNKLVELSRMDEESTKMVFSKVDLSNVILDTVSEFQSLCDEKEKQLKINIESNIYYNCDELLIRRLISILMDNAVKYCDIQGEINIELKQNKQIVLTIENTYQAVNEIQLDKLFDRFYRADKARTYTGGFGVGLSIAKAIIQTHKGEIFAYKKANNIIGFKVILKTNKVLPLN